MAKAKGGKRSASSYLTHENDRLRLRRNMDIVDVGSRGILFKSHHLLARFEGKHTSTFLKEILPMLDGNYSVSQVVASLSTYRSGDIHKTLALLAQTGVLEVEPEVEREETDFRLRPQLEFFKDIQRSMEDTLEQIRQTTVAIFGIGGQGAHLATALANEGIGHIKCFDTAEVREEDLYLSTVYDRNDLGERRENALSKHLGNVPTESTVECSHVDKITEEDVGRWIQGCHFAVSCVDRALSSVNYWINKATLKSGLSWCSSSLDGIEVVAGPIIIPGDTACYMCYRMRLIANENSYLDAIAYEKYLDSIRKDELFRRSNLGVAAALLGNLLALEVLKHATGIAPSPLVGKIGVLNLLKMSTEFHSVLRHPDCSHCGKRQG